MELKDVELKVEDPNQEYWIGLSCYSTGNGWDNFYTDGTIKILRDEGAGYSNQSNLVKVENATYVAIETFYDQDETEISKMKDHSYQIISSDPAETIKQVGLDNIFSPGETQSEDLTTSRIYTKQGIVEVADREMLPHTWK